MKSSRVFNKFLISFARTRQKEKGRKVASFDEHLCRCMDLNFPLFSFRDEKSIFSFDFPLMKLFFKVYRIIDEFVLSLFAQSRL